MMTPLALAPVFDADHGIDCPRAGDVVAEGDTSHRAPTGPAPYGGAPW